jgi:probable F420-dependent oxidoreductase
MAGFKVGVSLLPQHSSIDDLRRAWREAEALGVDSLWTWDHFFPLFGNPHGNHFEAGALLAAMAVETQRPTVGLMVACATYRNPELYAHHVVTVDHLSGGRAVLGIGAGWFERDFKEYGYDFGTAGGRLRVLEDSLKRIRARLEKLRPRPLGRIPICIGGAGEKVTLRLVAEHADIWNSFGPPATYRRKLKVLEEWCERTGRDPQTIERSANLRMPDLATVEAMVEAGCRHIVCSTPHPYDLEPAARALELARSLAGPAD